MDEQKLPLGRETGYPDKYAPDALCEIPRATSRGALGIAEPLPFKGVDTWNAWDLTWLDKHGRPAVATAEILVPADSPNLIESKSLKLYLNSFSMHRFESADAVAETMRGDLGDCAGAGVTIRVTPLQASEARRVSRLAGRCIDDEDIDSVDEDVNTDHLRANARSVVREDLHSHLLRSLCPVTAQPDIGSLQISYRGPEIDRAGLLRYVVSYRQHQDFHESCVERMFVEILERCEPESLSVHALYQRRGGIDINPFRSNVAERPRRLRLWRQ